MSSNEKQYSKQKNDRSAGVTNHSDEKVNKTQDPSLLVDTLGFKIAATSQEKLNKRTKSALSLAPVSPSRVKSAPSSPHLKRQRPPGISKTSSLTSIKPLYTRENRTTDDSKARRKSSVEASTPPFSPALRRKLENTEKIVKEAKMHIDDYRRIHPEASTPATSIDVKSLEEALKEVQSCRYLRVVDKSD